MIQAIEFRLGNYAFDDEGQLAIIEALESARHVEYDGVESEAITHSLLEDNSNMYCGSPYQGIPLTPSTIEAAGFRKNMSGGYTLMDEDAYLEKHEDGWAYLICISSNTGEFVPIAALQHLHQLQNLFYAINGKELAICHATLVSNQAEA